MECKKCGKEIPDDVVFCPWCGKRQETEKRKRLKRANGTGTVYKMKGRRRRPWVAARKKVIIGYYETRKEALEALEKATAGTKITERYNATFEEVFQWWSAEHFPTVQKSAIEQYTRAFKRFEPLHKEKFRLLRTQDFQAIVDRDSHLSHSSLMVYKNLLTAMSRWAMREEISTGNFAQFVRVPPAVKKEKETFTEEDIMKLEQSSLEGAHIILMLIYTGMRISELFMLPLEDYHGEYLIGGEKTAAGKNRVIPVPPVARPYFDYFAARAEAGGKLLSGYSGNKNARSFRTRDYYPVLESLGIKRRVPHCTRHTYASRARAAGMAPEILMKILGHSSYHTTAEIYIHTEIHQLIVAAETAFSGGKNAPKSLPENLPD